MLAEDFFESIEQQFNNKLPFVAYRKPNANAIKALLQKNTNLVTVSDFTESGFVFAPFDDNEEAVLISSENSKLLRTNVIIPAKVESQSNNISDNDNEIPALEVMTNHINLVQKGIGAIKENQFQKVVLSRCETVLLSNNNPITIFERLLNTYASAFVYVWCHPKVGLWLGATPETLLKFEGNRFSTMALAGTQEFKGTIDVQWDDKEKQEQQIVTDFIVNSLQSSTSSLQISDVETIKAGSLLHLKTTISGNLKPKTSNLKKLLGNLHPTPAVCGLPKESAKQFILKNEHYNREFYTGFLGELNLQEKKTRNNNRRNVENNAYAVVKNVSNLYVNLRCVQLKNNKAIIYVGGGITRDSFPESEWQETINKAEIIKRVL